MSEPSNPKTQSNSNKSSRSRRYIIYLTIIALAGWTMASFDFNLYTLTLPLTSKALHFTVAEAGILSGIIYLGQFISVLIFGPLMDRLGRKVMFQLTLLVSAIFTGFTAFVQNFIQFVTLRFISDGSAFAELPTGLTLITEESKPKLRGVLYGFVQGGWPLGVFLASAIYLILVSSIGWRGLYLVGLLPLVLILIGRKWVKETDRFIDLKKTLEGKQQTTRFKADLQKAREFPFKQLFTDKSIRRQLIAVNSAWMLYTFSFVTTNVVITLIFTTYYYLTASQAASILLLSSGIGYFAYPIAGWYGQKIGRRNAWAISSVIMPILAAIFLFTARPGNYLSVLMPYIPLYFFSNGTFASPGFMYVSESFPTRVRGTATGFTMALIAASYAIGGFLFYSVLTLTHSIYLTWIALAIILPLGSLSILIGKNIPPNAELEEISW
ncbi:MFS transporter [Saccharolobus solfataricus]|uniref:Amino acid transporter n=2 Tax=Saccharolobus solfataricus TaxID=2287 RepID=A0A0E3MH12_SACSO|nr:MFS transporter [Saccharolobus solfataricus]AKA74462.1 MFS transporter [Saccharolobus solfataricus]AKA77157.1 MFS transporter [Saccharolobus solfataricus]AKA79850.1 MFS transporter [Saccharolobus solfataricus]AZF68941.1 MFS transporter [Saccharolobus solfataricus]AZF71561.1 MFS transporter [Saccharolobus solfataricus]